LMIGNMEIHSTDITLASNLKIINQTPITSCQLLQSSTMTSTTSITQSAVLSSLDQYLPPIYTNIFLVFETPDTVRAVDNLRDGLRRLNQRLPYLRGRVSVTDHGRVAIRWSTAARDVELHEMPVTGPDGASLVLPRMTFATLKQEAAPLKYFPPCLRPLPREADVQFGSGAPVFAVNYAALEGGIVVGLAVQHNVMDGTGVVELVRFWADCTRSQSVNDSTVPDPEEPLHRNRLLRQAAGLAAESQVQTQLPPPSFNVLLARHPEFALRSQAPAPTPNPPTPPPRNAIKIFTFASSKLTRLKPALTAALQAQLNPKWVTTNTILTAILWSSITRVCASTRAHGFNLTAHRTSKLSFAVNVRTRLPRGPPNHPHPFLGNAILLGLAETHLSPLINGAAAGDLGALAVAVKAIAEAIQRVTPEHVGEVMDLVDLGPDMRDLLLGGIDNAHGPDLSVTSWGNMGRVYEADFGEGVGRVQFLRVAEADPGGTVGVLPRKAGEEGIEVIVPLYKEEMEVLERDAVWRCYLV
jgi:hypothetical protein